MIPTMPREDRPSYVEFVREAVEDRKASMESGHYMTKDVDFAVITPVGSKDRIPREVTAWFLSLEESSKTARIPMEWVGQYRRMYEAWKEGQEIPVNGTPIKGWPVLSPAQQANLVSSDIRTVEDLAQINEESQRRIGMGALEFRDKAISWLKASKGTGKIVQEMSALQIENSALRAKVESQDKDIQEMKAALKDLERRSPDYIVEKA